MTYFADGICFRWSSLQRFLLIMIFLSRTSLICSDKKCQSCFIKLTTYDLTFKAYNNRLLRQWLMYWLVQSLRFVYLLSMHYPVCVSTALVLEKQMKRGRRSVSWIMDKQWTLSLFIAEKMKTVPLKQVITIVMHKCVQQACLELI